MTQPRSYKTQAFVLRQMPLGEADRVLTLFSPEAGKVRAVARGVRRTRSRLGGHLEVLNLVSVSVGRGRTLDRISEAEEVQTYRNLREDLGRLSAALYLAELVDAFAPEQAPNVAIFHLLGDALAWLERPGPTGPVLRHFEVQLLGASGYGPELRQCVECDAPLEPGDHRFSCARGGVVCARCRTTPGERLIGVRLAAMKALRFLQRERLERVAGLEASGAVWADVERLLRDYIWYLAAREIKSVAFMDLVASARNGPPARAPGMASALGGAATAARGRPAGDAP